MIQEATLIEPVHSDPVSASRALILYDGFCGMCNSSVRWVVRRDGADRFRFATQDSPLAEAILTRHGIDRDTMLKSNSVYLALDTGTDRETLLTQSDVTVKTLWLLGGGWRILGYLLRLVPRFARDAAYRLIAGNRYRLSARYKVCPLPSEAERMKFLG